MMLHGFQKRPASRNTHRHGLSVGSCGRIRYEWSIPVSPRMLLFSEVGLSLTQHYRVYRGSLPHAVFRTDYIARLRSLLGSSGQSGSTPETERASTPKSVRRLHRSSQPKQLRPGARRGVTCVLFAKRFLGIFSKGNVSTL